MIYGIGVDMVHVPRIENALLRWGDRFLNKVYTSYEQDLCLGRPGPASALAMRFAAKEAFSKAIGLGMRRGVAWRDIEVFHHAGGRPGLRVTGKTLDICREWGITGMHVSLSDERDYACAVVLLEG
jgi:holo-[acyl-carrier protein] synthase